MASKVESHRLYYSLRSLSFARDASVLFVRT